jgi:uncharacterized alkaline shock family protein YloU
MSIKRDNELGSINISNEAIASLAGGIVTECYGVVGMASQKFFKDGLAELLKNDNYSKGVIVRKVNEQFELDLYIIVSYGVKITEVVYELQKKVKYNIERATNMEFSAINIFVQGLKVID